MVNGNCGQIIASSCVLYTGKDFTFVDVNDQLECNASATDAFEKIDKYLKRLVDSNNFTGLNKNCLDFNPATVKAFELHQIEIDEICLLKGQVEAIQEQINNLNIGNEIITINLQCLSGDAAPCAVGTNQYQLIAVLNTLVSKICDFETRISNLE